MVLFVAHVPLGFFFGALIRLYYLNLELFKFNGIVVLFIYLFISWILNRTLQI